MKKRGLVENIFSTILMVILFIVVSINLFSHTTKDIVKDYRNAEQIYLEESYSNTLNSVLEVDEGITGESMSRLVAKRVFYRKEVIDFKGQQINITDVFKTLLDKVYGEGTYFASIEPIIYDLSLILVFDGSESMVQERQTLADTLPGLIERLKQTSNLSVREMVYILSADDDLCNMFTDQNLSCKNIDNDDLYFATYLSCSALNADYRSEYCIVAPFLHTDREVQNYGWQERTRREREQYYESDWATGVTYALHRADMALSNVNIVFPISEEMSTSSFSDECFTDNYYNDEAKHWWRTMYCDICRTSDNPDTTDRGQRSVDKAIEMSADVLNDVIYPIYSLEAQCDYEYFTHHRHENLEWYFTHDGGGAPVTGGTYCGTSQCAGCQDTGSRPGADWVCLHPEMQPVIEGQMDDLASTTGGSWVRITNVGQLPDMIDQKVTDTLNSLVFTVGKEQNATRYGLERFLTLPGKEGNFARLRLFKYAD